MAIGFNLARSFLAGMWQGFNRLPPGKPAATKDASKVQPSQPAPDSGKEDPRQQRPKGGDNPSRDGDDEVEAPSAFKGYVPEGLGGKADVTVAGFNDKSAPADGGDADQDQAHVDVQSEEHGKGPTGSLKRYSPNGELHEDGGETYGPGLDIKS